MNADSLEWRTIVLEAKVHNGLQRLRNARRRRKTRKRRVGKEDEEEFLIQTHGKVLGEWQCC